MVTSPRSRVCSSLTAEREDEQFVRCGCRRGVWYGSSCCHRCFQLSGGPSTTGFPFSPHALCRVCAWEAPLRSEILNTTRNPSKTQCGVIEPYPTCANPACLTSTILSMSGENDMSACNSLRLCCDSMICQFSTK